MLWFYIIGTRMVLSLLVCLIVGRLLTITEIAPVVSAESNNPGLRADALRAGWVRSANNFS